MITKVFILIAFSLPPKQNVQVETTVYTNLNDCLKAKRDINFDLDLNKHFRVYCKEQKVIHYE